MLLSVRIEKRIITSMHLIKKPLHFIAHHKIITAIAIVVLLIIVFIFRPKPAPVIATQKVEPSTITQTVSVSGTVNAKNTAKLTFAIGGTISWIGVKVGDTVTQNQTIATLDERSAEKNLQNALLSYNIARNTFDQTAENNGGQSNQAALNIAPNDAITRLLQNNQSTLNQSIISVQLQDIAKQQSVLWTPIAGIVTRADTTTPGTTAIAGTTTFTVTDPTSTVFDMDVDEADIGKIQAGQTAAVTLDAYPDTTLSLPVNFIDFVSHATSNGGNAYTVEVPLANNTNYKYRVGMNGNADITTAQKKNVLTISLASIVNNNQVYIKSGKRFVLRTVTLGLQSDTETEVTSGLHAGDVIATDPTQITKK